MEKGREQIECYDPQKIIQCRRKKNHSLLKFQWLHVISGTSPAFHVITHGTTYHGKISISTND